MCPSDKIFEIMFVYGMQIKFNTTTDILFFHIHLLYRATWHSAQTPFMHYG